MGAVLAMPIVLVLRTVHEELRGEEERLLPY